MATPARSSLALRSSALVLLLLLGASVVATAAPGACGGTERRGGWDKIVTPLPARAFTVHARAGIVVAGDDGIMASDDGGCTWRTLFELTPALAPQERFAALTSADGSLIAVTTALQVLVSRDAGATWERGTEGLDLPGEPAGLHAAPSGGTVYLVARQEVRDAALEAAGVPEQGSSVVATVLYRSTDGGLTWARRGDPAIAYAGPHGSDVEGAQAPGALWDLAVDPLDPAHLLAASKGGVFRSTDGGASWSAAVFSATADVRAVSITRRGGAAAAVAVDPRSGTVYETSVAASGSWSRTSYPQLRTEQMVAYPHAAPWAWSAFGPGGEAVMTGPKGVFRRAGTGLFDVTPPHSASTVVDPAVFAGAGGPSLWARSLDGSALFVETPGARGAAPGSTAGMVASGPHGRPRRDPPAISVPEVDAGAARLEPARRRLTLAPGESRTVTYRALLEPQATPVDLYFLVDTTSSMSNTLRSLTRGMEDIVGRLAAARVELRAGVGAFRSYPRESDRQVQNYPYRRIRALGPVDDDLVRSLYDLEAAGSSGANLTALYQAVTGAGQDVLPPGPSKADVPEGLEAGFRDGSTKVVVHFADTWFATPERGDPNGYYAPGTWPGPAFAEVGGALRWEGVHHLGVAMQPSGGGTVLTQADVLDDLRLLSRQTSSLAGERGADCDGDGRPDLRAGEPLVCLLDRDADAAGLAAVVVGLVQALEHRGAVTLVEAGDSGLVDGIAPPSYPGVDLRRSHDLGFGVTIACRATDVGTTRRVRLALRVANETMAASALRVTCIAPLVTGRAPAPPEPRVPLIPPIPAPPPPPHSVPGLGPGSVTAPAPVQAPAPAQAPGGQPQGVLVTQRQQQPQLAFVAAAQQVRSQTQMQHAMVRTTARDPLATAKTWTAIGTLSLLWTWGLLTATGYSAGRARARRRGF